MQEDWKTDWAAFVQSVESRLNEGLSAADLSAAYAGTRVTWTGVVAKNRIDTYMPGITMQMPEVPITVGGRGAVVEYLFVPVDPDSADEWRSVQEGDEVVFECVLYTGRESGFEWGNDRGDGEAYLSISVERGRLLAHQ